MAAILIARDLVKTYAGFTALDIAELAIGEGTIHAVIGPNGAGKTTLFNVLSGFAPATRGSVQLAGEEIARHFAGGDAMQVPAVLVAGHGPFCWGPTAAEAAHNAVILEYVAEMAYYSVTLADGAEELDPAHLDKHFLRKHGVSAYYGQK